MATKLLKSVKGRRIRLTRLNASGAPLIGQCASIVTDGFISVTLSNELEAGEEYSQKNAWGEFCVSEKDGDIIKWLNVGLELCGVHPDILDVVAGANPILGAGGAVATVTNKALTSNIATLTTSAAHGFLVGQTITVAAVDAVFNGTYVIASVPTTTTLTYAKTNANVTSGAATGTITGVGNTIGASFGSAPNAEGFALEVWTRNAEASIASPIEWGYLVVPWVKNGQVDGDISVSNAVMTLSLKGEGYAATSSWGVNPYLDNPLITSLGFPVGDLFAIASTTVQPPALTAGCVALA